MQAKELVIIHKKLIEIPEIEDDVIRVVLRRNIITTITLENKPMLKELDLYDNKIKEINSLENVPNLIFLDLSFNLLKRNNLPKLEYLKELYLIGNDIENIEFMDLSLLNKLDLAENNIKKLKNLNHLTNLTELYLGNNGLTELGDFNDKLKVLDLQCNDFVTIDCKELPDTIETLMLNDNERLVSIKNLEHLKRLSFLGVLRTKLKEVDLCKRTKAQIWI